MKTLLSICLVSASAFHAVSADVPKKAPLVKYTGLWTNSPFTSKPPAPEPISAVNPLNDYALTGIAPVPGGHRVTIMNKKKPGDNKIVIEPGGNSDFKVISVNRNPGKPLGTTVVLSSGSMQGTVSFEPDLITLKAPPAVVNRQQQNANLPPGITPAMAAQQGIQVNVDGRQPRPRIVVPPGTPQTGNNGGTQGRDRRFQGGDRRGRQDQRRR